MMASAALAAQPQGVRTEQSGANVAPITAGSIWMLGEVMHPGMFQMKQGQPLTIIQAIALAGGFTASARKENIQVIRSGVNGNRETAVVDGRAVLNGAAPDVALNPNDVVFVPGRIVGKSLLEHWPILIAH
jgi:protein involved in polysaccharide export with SLBB domain